MAASSDNKLAYVELCPSSVVTHCVSCRLTAAAESCLVIARSTAVEVYTLSVTTVSNAAGGAAGKGRSAPLEGVCGAQLELLTRSELFGVVNTSAWPDQGGHRGRTSRSRLSAGRRKMPMTLVCESVVITFM